MTFYTAAKIVVNCVIKCDLFSIYMYIHVCTFDYKNM